MTKMRLKFLFALMLFLLNINTLCSVKASTETYSAYDYMFFEPGHYNQFIVNDNSLSNCVVELVFQDGPSGTHSMSLTQIGTSGGYWRNSHLSGWISGEQVLMGGGIPVGNQANYFRFIHHLPISFSDGASWADTRGETQFSAEYIGTHTVDSVQYGGCIKVTFDSTTYYNSYLRGTGEFILAKGIGIIEFTFDKDDGNDFSATLIEYGVLSPVTISGSYILEGSIPAEGYYVGLSIDILESGKHGSLVDENGTFTFQIFGNSIVLRYGPLRGDLKTLDYENSDEMKIDNISEDISLHLSGPDIGLAGPLDEIPPDIIIWPKNVNVRRPYILLQGRAEDSDGVENVTINDELASGWFYENLMSWQKMLNLTEEFNVFTIKAYDKSPKQNMASEDIVITYLEEGYRGPSIECVPLKILPYNRQEITFILNPNGEKSEVYLNWAEANWENAPFRRGRSLGYDFSGTMELILTYNFPEKDRNLNIGQEISWRVHTSNRYGWDAHPVDTFIVGKPDFEPPEISSLYPSDGETGVSLKPVFKITFNEQLDVRTIDSSCFELDGKTFEGEFDYKLHNYSALLIPSKKLNENSEYTFTVSPKITDYAGNNFTGYSSTFHTVGPTIDKVIVSPPRCDVNQTALVYVHLGWGNGTSVDEGRIFIDDIDYSVNSTGWISFVKTSSELEKITWEITGVNAYGMTKYNQVVENPSAIWDQVQILTEDLQRIDVGSGYEWAGRYMYNDEVFEGFLILNEPSKYIIERKEPVRWKYRVMGIIDQKYGLTEFTANDFDVIYDKVMLNVSIHDDRIDLGESPEISVSGSYAYDSTEFQGQVSIPIPTVNDVGKHILKVESISDPLYDLTVYESNEVSCIWDRLKIVDGGVSSDTTTVKKTVTIWFKAEYEYDHEVFTSSEGLLYVNGEPMEWSSDNRRWEKEYSSSKPQTIICEVSGMRDDHYGLTTINDEIGSLSIEWKQQMIPGFPYISIILGLLIGILLIYWMKRKF